MPQSLSNVLVHLTFSTKERRPLIHPDVEDELHHYLGGVCRDNGCPSHGAGGTEDHVHICFTLSRTITLAHIVEEVKRSSSKWIKTKGDRYRSFAWQAGYGAFSIGQSGLDALRSYIATQREHHKKKDFKAEFRALLRKYNIEYDETYVWD